MFLIWWFHHLFVSLPTKRISLKRKASNYGKKTISDRITNFRTNPAVDANDRLISLIQTAYRETGKQVVILIDEYDAPLLDVVHEDEKLEELRNAMRNFYSPLKGCEKLLRFVFLTGITKFSQLSIFSELKNITNISMDEPYAGICGITEDELVNGMRNDIEALAEKLNLSYEQTLAKLKDNYDGYHLHGLLQTFIIRSAY